MAASFERVVDAWRRTRHPRFAELAERISKEQGQRAPIGRNQWNAIEARNDWRDLPRLMDAMFELDAASAAERLITLARWDDPRLVTRLIQSLESPPHPQRALPFWRAFTEAIWQSQDPRAKEAMVRFSRTADKTIWGEIADQLHARAKGMPRERALEPDAEAELAWLDALEDGDEKFLADIVAAPDDDAARLIYADWLSEHGETRRGEFIVLQVDRAAGRGNAERSDFERLNYGASKLLPYAQPLSRVADRVGFDRGFPVAVTFARRNLGPIRAAPEWGTVRKLRGLDQPPRLEVIDFLLHGAATNLRDIAIAPRMLSDLGKRAWPWTHVDFSSAEPLSVVGLRAALLEGLPKLTHLALPTYAPGHPLLGDGVFAAAPNVVDLSIGDMVTAATRPLVKSMPGLRRLKIGRSLPPLPAFAGLPLEELDVRGDIEIASQWVALFPNLRKLTFKSSASERALVAFMNDHPSLERIDWGFGAGPMPLELERTTAGIALVALPGPRWQDFAPYFVSAAPTHREAGITELVLHPAAPRHNAAPIDPTQLAQIQSAWGKDRVSLRELL
jgi:uncharacterized protein (TIGR02996 family)